MGSHVEAAVRLSHVFPQSMPQVQFWPGQLLAPPPDGPANVGVMLVVLPVTLPDLALRSKDRPGSSVLMPDSFGYSGDHAVYFGTSVLIRQRQQATHGSQFFRTARLRTVIARFRPACTRCVTPPT